MISATGGGIVSTSDASSADCEQSTGAEAEKNTREATCAVGHLAVWDLERQTLLGQMRDAHLAPIHTLFCPHAEPLLISAGADNAIRSWSFDLSDGLARQLVERAGPALPATCVRFHGTDGATLLLTSRDATLRAYSCWRDTEQFNFGVARKRPGVGKKAKKQTRLDESMSSNIRLPPIERLSTEVARELHWDNGRC